MNYFMSIDIKDYNLNFYSDKDRKHKIEDDIYLNLKDDFNKIAGEKFRRNELFGFFCISSTEQEAANEYSLSGLYYEFTKKSE
jgi:hypothetical protein